ncbi:MAG: hypothetical protein HRU00_03665 [Myxococcales bacterium]|nr:hypothetical protein [Myxococcales bacterium]
MRVAKEFFVERDRGEILSLLDEDVTFESLFPGMRVTKRDGPRREIVAPNPAPGTDHPVRFRFETLPDGNLRFDKICDGNIWRSLAGGIELEPSGHARTRVKLRLEGKTRSLVPELAIRLPMREQVDQMTESLRVRLGAG